MIAYLEQLERDLVEAVASREQPPQRRRMPFRLAPALAMAILALGIAVAAVVLVRPEPDRHRYASPAHRSLRPVRIPPHTPLRVVGTVTRTNARTWRGPAAGPGGTGTLTVVGTVDLRPRPCCDTPPSARRHLVRFVWSSAAGTVQGCIVNATLRRPHGRWVWDGVGNVTYATGALRRYRGRGAGVAGRTTTRTPDRARLILSTSVPRRPC